MPKSKEALEAEIEALRKEFQERDRKMKDAISKGELEEARLLLDANDRTIKKMQYRVEKLKEMGNDD